MKIPAVLLIAVALGASVLACAEEPADKPAIPASPAAPASGAKPAAPASGPLTDAQASYRVGVSLGEQLAQVGISSDGVKADELARGHTGRRQEAQ